MIPFEDLSRVNRPYEREMRAAFEETVSSGRFVLGEQVAAFERELAGSLGVPHAVGVASGYDAITLALDALGLPRGEVVIPANTCVATILAVMRGGYAPVLSDPDPDTLLIDPEDVARRISPRTVAILPVHLYGLPCDMDALSSIARDRGLALVEDCAQAQGARWNGRPAGSFGDAAAFSFYPTKNLGALGDGGAVATRSAAVDARLRVLRNYGCRGRGLAAAVGLNSRLDELQAAILRKKLPRLDDLVRRKNAHAAAYDRGLSPAFGRPRPLPGATCARHLYPVLHPRRDELREHLAAEGIGTEIHYPVPPHLQEAIPGIREADLPVASRLSRTILSLPCSAGHTDAEIARVIEAANRFRG